MKKILERIWPDSLLEQLVVLFCLAMIILQVGNYVAQSSLRRIYVEKTLSGRLLDAYGAYAAFEKQGDIENADQLAAQFGVRLVRLAEAPSWPSAPVTSPESLAALTRLFHIAPEDFAMRLRLLDDRRALKDGGPYLQDLAGGLKKTDFPLLEVAIRLEDGSWISILQAVGHGSVSLTWIQRSQLLILTLLLAAFILLIFNKVARPLRRFRGTAEQFARNPESLATIPPLPENGVRELRDASRAFNLMRQKILDHIMARDRMLAAMAHDMRTPLTKLQLRLESVEPEELRDKILLNCFEIGSIVHQSIDLIRSPHAYEDIVSLDLKAFLESLVDDSLSLGKKIVWGGITAPTLELQHIYLETRPLCLRRCLVNLLENAFRYGEGAALSAAVDARGLRIEVSDNGPGIPADDLEKVFEPYFRVESSRNRDSGGTGLGLSIARNMAGLCGAELTLTNLPEGGLRARLSFPLLKIKSRDANPDPSPEKDSGDT